MSTQTGSLEHVNVTVSDADETAQLLAELFGWKVRWAGDIPDWGRSVHVGSENSYVALFTPVANNRDASIDKQRKGQLNHIGVVVDDLDAVETKVREHGLKPYSHADYEPGRRFYFNDNDAIEFEVVSYG